MITGAVTREWTVHAVSANVVAMTYRSSHEVAISILAPGSDSQRCEPQRPRPVMAIADTVN